MHSLVTTRSSDILARDIKLTSSTPVHARRSMDCDTLLVLSAGRLVEQGAPAELAARPGGAFARLARAATRAAAS